MSDIHLVVINYGTIETILNKSLASDLDTSSSGLHGLLGALAAVERKLLTKISLPFGLSVLAIGRAG